LGIRNWENLKKLLDNEVEKRDDFFEVSYENPDPILIARRYKDERISLICSLFAYGRVSLIVKFLENLDFSLLEANEDKILKNSRHLYYRFQNSLDVANIFITLKRLQDIDSLENIFYEGYKKEQNVIDGLREIISKMKRVNSYDSKGFTFLIGNTPPFGKISSVSPYKRWNMYLRWMARCDNIDMGLWEKVDKKDLIIPLDTHTFSVSKKLGLLNRKTYDLKAAIELTSNLKKFDPNDPVKYDFALYRIGQLKIDVKNKE